MLQIKMKYVGIKILHDEHKENIKEVLAELGEKYKNF